MPGLNELVDEVVTCDVLVVGGGIAGCFAALEARNAGLSVVIADRAKVGRGGISPQVSGMLTYFDPQQDDYDKWYQECLEAGQGLVDEKRLEGMIPETTEIVRDLDRWGCRFEKRDGKYLLRPGVGHYYAHNAVMTKGGFQMMSVLRGEVLRRSVRLVERVSVAGLLTSDGLTPTQARVTGALAFSLRTGRLCAFVSKATLLATGSLYGYLSDAVGVGQFVPSLSGDGVRMALEVGGAVRNMDIAYATLSPLDFNCAPGAALLFGEGAHLLNSKGERFMEHWDARRMERAPRVVVCRAIATEEEEGRGPVYLDATHLSEEAHRRVEDACPIVVRSFAKAWLSLRTDRIAYWAHLDGDGPAGVRVDRRGDTGVPGLFAGGALTDHPEDGVSNIIGHAVESAIGGRRAGRGASEYALEAQEPYIDPAQVGSFKEDLLSPLKRESGIDCLGIKERVKPLRDERLIGLVKSPRRLERARALLSSVRHEVLPAVRVTDYHTLAKAIGLRAELLQLEAMAACGLHRTESRGVHYREDYPERDDAKWLRWTFAELRDGGMRIWNEPVK